MYLLHNLRRYTVRVNEESKLLEIGESRKPMPYAEAATAAAQSAAPDSESFRRRQTFQTRGTEIGEADGSRHVYDFTDARGRP
jgi:hypothetical protein